MINFYVVNFFNLYIFQGFKIQNIKQYISGAGYLICSV